jgi:glycine hydroxymethyltransferase
MEKIVDLVDEVIMNHSDEARLEGIAEKVNEMMAGLPLFKN